MTNIETKIKEWSQEELESSRLIIAEYTDENRPKCDDGSDDFIEGNDADADLWDKVEAYIGVPLGGLTYCKNQPHKLTSFK